MYRRRVQESTAGGREEMEHRYRLAADDWREPELRRLRSDNYPPGPPRFWPGLTKDGCAESSNFNVQQQELLHSSTLDVTIDLCDNTLKNCCCFTQGWLCFVHHVPSVGYWIVPAFFGFKLLLLYFPVIRYRRGSWPRQVLDVMWNGLPSIHMLPR